MGRQNIGEKKESPGIAIQCRQNSFYSNGAVIFAYLYSPQINLSPDSETSITIETENRHVVSRAWDTGRG